MNITETFPIFIQLGFLLAFATLVSLLMRALKQPLIIGYIITGLLVGPFVFNLIQSEGVFQLFSQIGVSFLLFSVGLNLNPNVLKQFGKVALITGVGQVVFTSAVGFLICVLLGFSYITSFYVSIALAFSSTIIILKLISDKGDLEDLYAKISIGFLLVQDVIAIALLLAIPILFANTGSWADLGDVVFKILMAGVFVFAVARSILPKINDYISRSQELLFLFANAWGIGITALFLYMGFSIEAGALVAGIALSTLPFRHDINARLTPLRDFFIVLFFILLGSEMAFGSIGDIILPAAILSLLVLVGNPLIMMIIMGLLGYKRKTGLLTGLTVAQISEFSLILVALGVSLGQIDREVLSMVTLVGLVTIFGSSYLILYSDKIYSVIGKYLKIFERKHVLEKGIRNKDYDYFLFGGNRVGFDFIELFKGMKKDFLVIDHDPEIIGQMKMEKVDHEYGDASDIDFLESLKLDEASLIVSTIPDLETNLLIAEAAKRHASGPIFLTVTHSISNALALYEAGVDYVILPHFLGGKYASEIAKRFLKDAKEIRQMRKEHVKNLLARSALGHEHPVLERFR